MTWPALGKVDLTSKNSTIIILILLDCLFLGLAILAVADPTFSSLKGRMWELFSGTNAALFLSINVGAMGKQQNPNTVPVNVDPTKPDIDVPVVAIKELPKDVDKPVITVPIEKKDK